MAGLQVRSLLVTGANRGIGLGLVRQLLGMPNPPEWVFAACRDPKGERAQVGLPHPGSPGMCPGAARTLGALHREGTVPTGRCLRGHRALPSLLPMANPKGTSLGEHRGLPPPGTVRGVSHHGDTDLPCPGSAEVTDPASIKAAAARVGEQLGGSGLNLLINNAGIAKLNLLDTETLEDMSQVYTTNTVGPLLLSQAFLPLLKKAAQGSPGSALSCSKAAIINMSSYGGSIASPSGWDLMQVVSYRCSKAALNMLTKCQSLGYREHGVLCAALHPGWVQTDMGSSAGHTPPVTVDASARGMLKVLSSLSEKDTGTFLDWEGNVVPW
ncbi:PREDICTED: uncharacterized oxidoreductase C663.06c [Aptenodytes forsteri]|uniref:uncharacterized oxidoreductase C663.06c n=1 Tax=Aptenodytes forsteri TaxID=9233 RepID=UPI0004F48A70|nr:PREDICTED: uncharacterized oxidoreductase C663.06c [Aptenodytes forsteri]